MKKKIVEKGKERERERRKRIMEKVRQKTPRGRFNNGHMLS